MRRTTYKILATERGMRMYQDGKFVTGGAAKIAEEWTLRMARTLKNMQGSNISSGLQISIDEIDPKNNEFDN